MGQVILTADVALEQQQGVARQQGCGLGEDAVRDDLPLRRAGRLQDLVNPNYETAEPVMLAR